MYTLTPEQQQQLEDIVGQSRLATGKSSLELHIHDISPHTGVIPTAILWPVSTEEVAKILEWSYLNNMPVTPWGAGTSTEGNPVPAEGGLVVNMTQMNILVEFVLWNLSNQQWKWSGQEQKEVDRAPMPGHRARRRTGAPRWPRRARPTPYRQPRERPARR